MLHMYYLLFLFFCLLFILVVIIETNVMRKWFKTETFGELIRINLASNGLSKLVGISIAFFISFILQILTVLIFGWEALILTIPLIILLIFIAYFISVWIEQWVVTKFLGKKYNQEVISQAVRSANKTSYIFAFLACALGFIMHSAYQTSPRYKQNLLEKNTFDRATEAQEVL